MRPQPDKALLHTILICTGLAIGSIVILFVGIAIGQWTDQPEIKKLKGQLTESIIMCKRMGEEAMLLDDQVKRYDKLLRRTLGD